MVDGRGMKKFKGDEGSHDVGSYVIKETSCVRIESMKGE